MNIMNNRRIRLGVNIDHIATIRNARGGAHPSPVLGAMIAQKCGADGITLHLREDRRHIKDKDVFALKDAALPPQHNVLAAAFTGSTMVLLEAVDVVVLLAS